MANRRVVNPYMAVVAAVSVACVIGPLVVVRGEVNAYWCSRNSIDKTDTESSKKIDDVLTALGNSPPEVLRDGRGEYYVAGVPTADECCGYASCGNSTQDLNTGAGVPPSWFCGHASCNNSVQDSDCAQCVAVATEALREVCKSSIGGQIQLQGCRIRYEAVKMK